MKAILFWICIAWWLISTVAETTACIIGYPIAVLELDWADILIRDWCIIAFFVIKIIDEYEHH